MARRPKLEPITPEEIMDSPALQGFDRFLRFRSNDDPAGQPQAPISDSPTGELHIGDIEVPVFRPKPKIRHTLKMQDGHSSGEQALYQALWNAATPEGPDSRLICTGYGGMQELCGLDKTNCKDNIRSLIEKLAVEVVAGFSMQRNQGNTYRILSSAEIQRRRKAAGLEWVIRNRGVRFVASPVGESPMGISLAASGPLAQTVREFVATFSDDEIRLLVHNCRLRAPDASEAEILEIIRQKGFQLSRLHDIADPMAWLMEAVPKCFEGEALRRYRAERAILFHSEPRSARSTNYE